MSIISLYEKSENLFFVGGVVRDELLGLEANSDIDLTYVGDAVKFFSESEFEIVQVNEEFGSVHLKIGEDFIDITSTRTETYPKKGQLPLVKEIGCSLKEDVVRRDFSVNAIAKNCKSAQIVDYVGGLEDLRNKKLRILHENSFVDDPTRIIRGLKFAIRFGFELEENTKRLQDEYLKNVNYEMSFKRLKDELVDAFSLNKQEVLDKFIEQKMFKLLSDKSYVPYLISVEEFIKPYLPEINYLWLIYLGGFNLENLPLTKKELKIIDDYKKLVETNFADKFERYKMFKSCDIEAVLIYGLTKNIDEAKEFLQEQRHIQLNIKPQDLLNLGFSPSKKISQALEAVIRYKLDFPDIDFAKELEIAEKIM